MIARITVIDDDGKEILTEERKVWEEPRITDDGFRYTDCCVKLRFSIAETEKEKDEIIAQAFQNVLLRGGSYCPLPKCVEKEQSDDSQDNNI